MAEGPFGIIGRQIPGRCSRVVLIRELPEHGMNILSFVYPVHGLYLLPLFGQQEVPAVIGKGEVFPETIAIPVAGVGVIIEGALGAPCGLLVEE